MIRALLGIVKHDVSRTIVAANLPDLTKLPRFALSQSTSTVFIPTTTDIGKLRHSFYGLYCRASECGSHDTADPLST
jgi:hypothetical protein